MGRAKKSMELNPNPPVSSSSEEEETDDSDIEKSKPALEPEKVLKSNAEESSEEETEDDDEEEEESDDEEQAKSISKSKPDTEASMESGSDDDSPSASAFTIKPAPAAASKPAIETEQKDTPVKVTGKRALETTQLNGNDLKVKKIKASNKEDDKTEENKSSGGVIRWTEKDEIAVLNGLIRYKLEKGTDGESGLLADFLKGSIRSDVSKTQLNDKVKRMKRKFLKMLEKSENGKELVKPHDLAFFDLSKKIWNSNNSNKSNKKAEKPKEEIKAVVAADEPIKNELDDDFLGLYEILRFPNMSEQDSKKYFQKNMNVIGSSKAKEISDQWKKLQVKEFEVYMKKLALKSELSKLMLDCMKN